MRHGSKNWLVALLASALLALSACTGGTAGPSGTEAGGEAESEAPDASAAGGSEAPEESAAEGATLPEPELDSINIGLNGTEASQFTLAAATMLGILEKNGITAEFSTFEGDGQVAAALQSGQLDFVSIAVAVPIASQLTDAPLVTLAVPAQILTDHIVCGEGIETHEDVVGKRIAISTFGGTSHGAALLAIRAMGLTPDDVTITQVGGQGDRIAALEGGSIECAVVDANRQADMEEQGFNVVVDLKAEGVEWGRSGLASTKEWVEQYPNTALVIVASALEAQNQYWEDPDAMAEIFAEVNQITVEEAMEQVLDFQEIGNRDLMWTEGAFENPKEILASVEAEIAEVDVADAYDRSILEQLEEMGYYEALGIPIEE